MLRRIFRRVMSGKQKASNLSALEKSYYDACMKYLSGEKCNCRGLGCVQVQNFSSGRAG